MTTGLPLANASSWFRGQTLRFKTTFYDFDNNIIQPASAEVIVFYSSVSADDQELTIPMAQQQPGNPLTAWIATLDTRNFAAGHKVQWSVNTPSATQAAVQDGSFMLTANQANQPTF
jgi:hypothetical protein